MTYKNFSEIITKLNQQRKLVRDASRLKVDLLEFDTNLYNIIDLLFEEVYGKEGKGWIDWFIYDRDGRKEMKAWDEHKKPICYSVKSLWEFLEKNYKGTGNELPKNG